MNGYEMKEYYINLLDWIGLGASVYVASSPVSVVAYQSVDWRG